MQVRIWLVCYFYLVVSLIFSCIPPCATLFFPYVAHRLVSGCCAEKQRVNSRVEALLQLATKEIEYMVYQKLGHLIRN
jgi:hypothetical protein